MPAPEWQPIETSPKNQTIILANFKNACLLTGAPHVWTATYVTKWVTFAGEPYDELPMWCECSFAATNENGEPTHWMPLPEPPKRAVVKQSVQEVAERWDFLLGHKDVRITFPNLPWAYVIPFFLCVGWVVGNMILSVIWLIALVFGVY